MLNNRQERITDMKNAIKLENVTKKYKDFTLGEINLEIPCGFSTALIGSNGSGKTTLLDVMCNICGKNSGKITYFDKYTDVDEPDVRNNIGYCAANNFFPLDWTSKKVAYVMELAFSNFKREKFISLCNKMKIDTPDKRKQKKIMKMSDGNKMRLYLAAILARDSKFLILDEPASALDSLMRDMLCDMFREYLAEKEDRTILFSTHNIADMEFVTDYTVFMAAGKVVEKGFVEELKEKYRLIHGSGETLKSLSQYLISYTANSTMFEGICLTEHSSVFQKLDAAIEIPTLQQLSVGILRKAEKDTTEEE